MSSMQGWGGGFQQPLALVPDSVNANTDLTSTSSGASSAMSANLTPTFVPIVIPGVASYVVDSVAARVMTLSAASTIGVAIYSGTVSSADNIALSLVGQLNATLSGAATGSPHGQVTTGAAASGAAAITLDFTRNHYWVATMVSNVATLRVSGITHGATLTESGLMLWTATARSSTTDWPSSTTQASLGAPAGNAFPIIRLLTTTGVNLI